MSYPTFGFPLIDFERLKIEEIPPEFLLNISPIVRE
jgi:hypothetical protein